MREVQRLHMDINIKYPEFALFVETLLYQELEAVNLKLIRHFFLSKIVFLKETRTKKS